MAKYVRKVEDWSLVKLKAFRSRAQKWEYVFAWEEDAIKHRQGWDSEDWEIIFGTMFGQRNYSPLEIAIARVKYDR